MKNKIKNSLKCLIGITLMSLFAVQVQAQSFSDSPNQQQGFYLGAGGGVGNSECTDCGSDNGKSEKKQDAIFNLEAGYQFNQFAALEANFNWLPAMVNKNDESTSNNNAGASNVDIRGSLPLGDNFSAFGKIGAAFVGIGEGSNNTDVVIKNTTMGVHYAAGLGYFFSQHLRGSVSANYIDTNSFDGKFSSAYALANLEYLF